MTSPQPKRLQTLFLLARRLVLGQPSTGPPSMSAAASYQFDAVRRPQNLPRQSSYAAPPRPTFTPPPPPPPSSFQASKATYPSDPYVSKEASKIQEEQPYQFETVPDDRPEPVPIWYDSPNFRPDAQEGKIFRWWKQIG
eukprot:CAMPEP_0176172612 /NCGR_PEP_ID=MMETSP0120_2-20121206/88440_1 /TAXON_ID=160619 /ORGANISM="Kryptoperidinium foliaceum, Strain CCMP 1326" /LENGTH=138 /DNA_ID=CAMNT_0017510613 /DNA_START=81 /DNA_END=497 /DNA_ORIENTATION=+